MTSSAKFSTGPSYLTLGENGNPELEEPDSDGMGIEKDEEVFEPAATQRRELA